MKNKSINNTIDVFFISFLPFLKLIIKKNRFMNLKAIFIPANFWSRRTLKSGKLFNKLAIFEHLFVKTDNIRSGNVSPNIPKSLPLKREKFFPLIFSDYRVKCGIWDQKLKSMTSGRKRGKSGLQVPPNVHSKIALGGSDYW